jgi:hypothetical protein
MPVRTSFHNIQEGADYLGLPTIPEICVTLADADTGCDYTLSVFLERRSVDKKVRLTGIFHEIRFGILFDLPFQQMPSVGPVLDKKRHFSTLSTDNEDEEIRRTSRSKSANPPTKVNVAERDAAQLKWLRGVSGYDNAIAIAMREQVKTKQPQPSCATSIFAAYVYIVLHITPGVDCEQAGRVEITQRLLAEFLECQSDWITKAKAAGRLQVSAGDIPTVKAHMDGDMPDTYMGMKRWTEFLNGAVRNHHIKTESIS